AGTPATAGRDPARPIPEPGGEGPVRPADAAHLPRAPVARAEPRRGRSQRGPAREPGLRSVVRLVGLAVVLLLLAWAGWGPFPPAPGSPAGSCWARNRKPRTPPPRTASAVIPTWSSPTSPRIASS